MTALRLLIALPLAALAACVPPAPEPTPAPSPTPTPMPQPSQAPPQVVTPTYDDWMDAPQTPGDWFYSRSNAGSSASFGQPRTDARFAIGCDFTTRAVSLVRSGQSPATVPMTIRTETADRQLSARPENEGLPTLVATLPARDSLLDAIAFSKGRFAVEVSGLESLYLPAWPEISRVIDDCR